MGDIVFRVLANGEVIAAKHPDTSGVKWSKAQKAQRQRFKPADDYVQAAMALSDFFNGRDFLLKK